MPRFRLGFAPRFRLELAFGLLTFLLDEFQVDLLRGQTRLGGEDDPEVMLLLQGRDFPTFLVEEKVAHLHRNLGPDFLDVVLHQLGADLAQQAQAQDGHGFEAAAALTGGARGVGAGLGGGPQALAGEFQQAELGDVAHGHPGLVFLEALLQGRLHLLLVLLVLHVDEIDDYQAAQVPQPELPGHFVGGLQVGLQGGLLQLLLAGAAAGVDIDGHQGLGGVDDDAAAGFQGDPFGIDAVELVLHLVAGKDGQLVRIKLQGIDLPGRRHPQPAAQLLEDVRVVHQDGGNVRGQIVPDGAGDEVQVPVKEAGRLLCRRGLVQVFPLLQEKLQVLGQILVFGLLAGGADDETHLRGQADLLGQLLQAGPLIFSFNLAGDPQVGLPGQEHHITAGQGDVGAEIGPLGAGLFLVDLDDDLLAFAQHSLNFGLGLALNRLLIVVGVHLRQGQEAVAFAAVIDEGRLEAGLDVDHQSLVNVGFGLLPGGGFQGKLVQLALLHDANAKLLRV